MLLLVQKLLEISMRLDNSKICFLRLLGKGLGIFPVYYSRRMEKRLFCGTWDPVKPYRKRKYRSHQCRRGKMRLPYSGKDNGGKG